MIYTDVVLTINNDISTVDRKIVLYRGDKNVEIRFYMKGNAFVVLNTIYAQLIINRKLQHLYFQNLLRYTTM